MRRTAAYMGNEEKTESGNAVDRRRARRYAYRQLVWFKILEETADRTGDSVEGVSRSCDISTSGLGLISSVPMPVGKNAFLEIPAKGFKFSAMGTIVYSHRTEDDLHHVGIRFSVIPPNNRIDLDRLIESRG